MSLVNDVADALEHAAAGPLHTPALYSGFLRALVSAKTEPPSSETEGQQSAHSSGHTTSHEPNGAASGSGSNTNVVSLAEFQFDSEMGPVADMSTFPPTMAPFPTEDNLGMLTMDSILSASFWDSVLVPGKSVLALVGRLIGRG